MGLNSKTFNYLQANSEDALMLKQDLKVLKGVGTDLKQFYTNCVSYSRACKLTDVAKSWPAYTKWRYETNSYQYLKGKVGAMETSVFVDEDVTNDQENFSGYSFSSETSEVMAFDSDFLK